MGVLFDFGIQLLGAVSPLIASGIGALILRGTALLNAKITDQKKRDALGKISEVVITVVQGLLQTGVEAAKKANGGTLSAEQAADYKKQALDAVSKIIGQDMLKEYGTLLGYADILTFIDSKIESAIYAAKQGIVQATTSSATDTVLQPFYQSDAAHPAQKGAGTVVGAPPPAPQPVTR